MNLTTMERNRLALISVISEGSYMSRFRAHGIHPGAHIELLGRASSRGLLVKVDDTRLVLNRNLAEKIICTYCQNAE